MTYDITTVDARNCPVCGGDDLELVGNGTRVVCVECEARGIQAGPRQWLWAPEHAVRALRAAYDDADRKFESE